VELLLDAEEQQAFEGLALQALESVCDGLEDSHPSDDTGSDSSSPAAGPAEVPLAALMAAVPAAAREAASAWSLAWADYELSDARRQADGAPAVIDGSKAEEAQALGRRLAALAGNEVLPLPFHAAIDEAAAAGSTPVERDGGVAGSPDSSESSPAGCWQAAVAGQRPALRRTEAAAYALASSAAVRFLDLQVAHWQVGEPGRSDGGSGPGSSGDSMAAAAAGMWPPLAQALTPPPRLNTVHDRGVDVQAAEEILEADGRLGCLVDVVELLVALCHRVCCWRAAPGPLFNQPNKNVLPAFSNVAVF
jgi:hypothetical protein